MKRSEFVMLLARRLPFLFRQLISLSVQGYIPPIHRHWLFLSMASQLFEEEGLPIWRSPYKLHVPRDLMDIYLNYVHYLDHEPQTRRVFLTSLQPGFVVIDVGANIGYYTLLAAGAVGPKGRVHAVECAAIKLEAARTQRQAEQATKRPNPSVRRSQRARQADLERLECRACWVQSVFPLADRPRKRYHHGHTWRPSGRRNSVSRSSRKD